jgi:hypothetical protein
MLIMINKILHEKLRAVLDTKLYDKIVSDLRHVSGFLRVLRFHPQIK